VQNALKRSRLVSGFTIFNAFSLPKRRISFTSLDDSMLIDRHAQMNLFDSIVPTTAIQMDPILQQIDQLLDDDTLFLAVKNDLSKRFPQTLRRGRRSTPVEVTLRMLLLKHLYNWSYEDTEHFVKDSLSFRQFCRVYLDKVPDDTVLIRWANLISEPTLRTLHEHLVREAARRKMTRGKKLRVDTTVVETNIRYPTDSTLLQNSVRALSSMSKKVSSLATAAGVCVRDFSRSAKRRALNIIKFTKGRNDDAKKAVKRAYQELCEITQRAVHQVAQLQEALKENTSRTAQQFLKHSTQLLPPINNVIAQTRKRVIHQQEVPATEKVVSLHEPTTAILRRGKRSRPTEFGHMVKLQEVDGGIISDVEVLFAATSDSDLLVPSVKKHIEQFGRPPSHLAGDRAFSSTANEENARQLRVKYVALPAKGKLSLERKTHERQRWFKKLHRFRVGIEAKISYLKRCFGLRRSLYKGDAGFTRWVYLATIACNATTIARRLVI
jgi:transposase, IS5 family